MRFQLALNVHDLDAAIAYYERLLGAPVNKRKPGYANFAVDEPPLKLVLFEAPDATDRLNHVGFETDAPEFEDSVTRLEAAGVAESVLREETCCYAEKSTVYSRDPEGLLWEFYRFRGDSETAGAPAPEAAPKAAPERSEIGCC
jgi:catechol 2,3-dioxygenase-like lactoylglutathione lyase family enzyme